MSNVLFIQGENPNVKSYIFKNTTLLTDKNKLLVDLSLYLVIKKLDLTIKDSNNPKVLVVKKFFSGFLVSGIINEKDDKGRVMTFTCYFEGRQSEVSEYIKQCLLQINKSVNKESVKVITSVMSNYFLTRNIVIALLIILFIYSITN